ncbi:MAG: protease inhibitor I42 family protein [Candidatus Magnetominusculus sp. LBB02]|nr:protease inhibitor I42 family protein [Candidatus Magnetominusculus sp. LBB02]
MYRRTLLLTAAPAALILFSLLISVAVAFGGKAGGLVLTKKDNGGTFKVKSGEVISIGLHEVGAAGYAWYFDKLDTDYFEALGDKSVTLLPDDKTGKQEKLQAGSRMFATWMLMARKKGKSELKLRYYRIWEGPQTAVETFSAQIEIE